MSQVAIAPKLLSLDDIEKLPGSRFTWDNSVNGQRLACPAHCSLDPQWWDSGFRVVIVDEPYLLIGWCNRMPKRLMVNREGNIGLMFWSEEDGHVWQHYPLFDRESRDKTRFFVKRQPLPEVEQVPETTANPESAVTVTEDCPPFLLLQFNTRRFMRGAPAARMDCGDDGWLWMTRDDVEANISDFGPHPELLLARKAYKTPGMEYRNENRSAD